MQKSHASVAQVTKFCTMCTHLSALTKKFASCYPPKTCEPEVTPILLENFYIPANYQCITPITVLCYYCIEMNHGVFTLLIYRCSCSNNLSKFCHKPNHNLFDSFIFISWILPVPQFYIQSEVIPTKV